MPHTEQTMRILANGWLPGWAGLLLGAGLALFVLWQLRLEFRRVRPSVLTRWVLPGLRLGIVGLLTWLLCRPELLLTTRWTEKPRLLLLTDQTRSLAVAEEFASRHEKLDTLELLGLESFPKRQRAAAVLARLAAAAIGEFEPFARACQDDLDRLGTGLPPAPGLGARLDTASRAAVVWGAQLDVAKTEMPPENGDKTLAADIASLQQVASQLAALLKTLSVDAAPVRQSAAAHPDVLERYTGKLKDTLAAARVLLPLAHAVQDKLDTVSLPAPDLERVSAKSLTRQDIAARIVAELSTRTAATFDPERGDACTAAAMLDRRLQGNLAAVIGIGDGTAAWSGTELQNLALLGGIPVHTVLVGQDGVQPQDAGIIAVEAPPLAVRGRLLTLRVLATCNLLPAKRPTLTVDNVSAKDRTTATTTLPLPETAAGETVLSLPLTLDQPGYTHLRLTLTGAQADAFPGNESADAYVSVWPEAPRLLLASGAVNRDTAAWIGVLTALAPDTLDVLVYEPGLREFTLGNERGTFPATAADWQRVDLAVLTGPVLKGLPAAALTGLKDAVRNGLRIVLQDTGPAAAGASLTWAGVLGVDTTPQERPGKLHPPTAPYRWVEDLYHLGSDKAASEERLAALPMTPYLACTGGAPLLAAANETAVAVTLQGEGRVLYCGIPHFGALRTGGNSATVSRLMTGLATYALRLPPPAPEKPVIADPMPNDRADFVLTPQAANLAAIAKAARGQSFTFTDDVQKIVEALPKAAPVWREQSRLVSLWSGAWPLALLLLLVSAEYLLRRRAGRVM